MNPQTPTSWTVSVCLSLCLLGTSVVQAETAAEANASLEAAELSFAASVAAKDIEAFASHLAENAIFAAGPVRNGKTEILKAWSGFFSENAPKMEWYPETVVVQSNGRLGLSKGPYKLTHRNEDGSEEISEGQFISIWERQEDGSWRIIFDSGCPPCPQCGAN